MKRSCNKRRIRWGVSTAEVAISTLLVGLVSVGALRAVGGVLQTRAESDKTHARAALAQAMLTEIAQAPYENPDGAPSFGPEFGEFVWWRRTRENYDDVDDYHGWWESPPCPKNSRTGLPGYEGWTRIVTIAFVNPTDPQTTTTSDSGLKRITITIMDPQGRITTHRAFRSKWGAADKVTSSSNTVQTYVSSELEVNSDIHSFSGTNLPNHVPDL